MISSRDNIRKHKIITLTGKSRLLSVLHWLGRQNRPSIAFSRSASLIEMDSIFAISRVTFRPPMRMVPAKQSVLRRKSQQTLCRHQSQLKGCPARGHLLSGRHGLPLLRCDGWNPIPDGIAGQLERNSHNLCERQTTVKIQG